MSATVRAEPDYSNFRVVHALNREWTQLLTETAVLVRRWSERHPALDGCTGLDDLLARIPAAPDPVLSALLAECANGEALAGRVVLQAMLGKLVRMAARDGRAEVDEYVAAMWCVISNYPLAARPARIAANLALDTLKAVVQETHGGRRSLQVVPVPPGTDLDQIHDRALRRDLHDSEVGRLTAEEVLGSARLLGLVDDVTHGVLRTVYADGLAGREAAVAHSTTPEMIRYRCSRGVRQLARHASALAEAA